MLNKKIFSLLTMSTLLTSTVFGAGTVNCPSGACFATIGNSSSVRTFKQNQPKIEEDFQINEIDHSIPIILNGEAISIFPSYVMADAEMLPMEDEIILNYIEKIEDVIFEETTLPTTEYFCDEDKLVIYEEKIKDYVCV